MRQAFEAATKAYETVKKSVQEKWEGFKKKFEGTKAEMSQEVLKAESPEDLIALGKKLQEQGEVLKAEEEGVKMEEAGEEKKQKTEEGKMISVAHEKALEMNVAFDANKATEKAEVERAAAEKAEAERVEAERVAVEEQAAHEELVKQTQAAEQTKLAEIRAALSGESATSLENVESSSLTERLATSDNEVFAKYGDRMRQAADELVLNRQKMIENEKKLREVEFKSPEWQKLWDENRALNDRRNELSEDASWGSKVIIDHGQRSGETYNEYSNRRSSELKKYREAAMDDPHVVLRMIEAGELGSDASGDGLGKVSERLMSDAEFVREAMKLSRKYTENSYAGWFWKNVSGEVKTNKELFVEAVKLNHLNYQFGLNEFRTDPEIQKIALQSGLSPEYLMR